MSLRGPSLLDLLDDDRGAASSVEFILIVAFIVAPLGMLAFVSKRVTADYFATIANWVSSPFP